MFGFSRWLSLTVMGYLFGFLAVCPLIAEPFSPVPKSVESFKIGTIHVDKYGSGDRSLVLIPGLASGGWVWYDTIAQFSASYTIYVITLPGFDDHPATNERPLFTVFARDFWMMLETHKIAKPIVIGHSLGGTLAIALAEEHPERLSGIVAADGLPVFPRVASMTPEQRKVIAGQMANVFASQSKAESLVAQRNYMSTTGTNKPELIEPAATRAARSDPKAIAAWMQELLTNDLRPGLAKITIPFLEIMPFDPNQQSQFTQEQALTFYQSLIRGAPQSDVVAVAPSFHFVMLDQPEAFYKAIRQFIAAIK